MTVAAGSAQSLNYSTLEKLLDVECEECTQSPSEGVRVEKLRKV
jgi:hypothetical protein